MLTLESLTERLADWSAKFKLRYPTPEASPILLYQSLFALVHDLKSSIHLSEDPQIRGLVDLALQTENTLRELAFDQRELPKEKNASLHLVAQSLAALENLHVLLEATAPSAKLIPKVELELFSLDYSWEGLARARAASCSRHDYVFFERTGEIKLSEFGNYDEILQNELRPFLGVDIARQLAPKAQSPFGGDLHLQIRQMIALPRHNKGQAPSLWKAL